MVDDTPFNLLALSSILERYKLKLDTAYSGIEAIKKVENYKSNKCQYNCSNYRIILMDIEMPLMDGIETT
jgi:CheY-like chemotaxis protein